MGLGVRAASRVQIGKEATRGTEVDATRRLLLPEGGLTYRTPEDEEPFETDMTGTLARAARDPVTTGQGTELEYAAPLDLTQVLMLLSSGVKGGVSPTSPGTGDARLWTFEPEIDADPTPDTYTVEWVDSDFVDDAERQGTYLLTTEITFEGGVDGLAQLSGSLMGRATKTGTPTTETTPSAWAVSTSYVIGDKVEEGGSYYRCIRAHTSATGNVADGDPSQTSATAWADLHAGADCLAGEPV